MARNFITLKAPNGVSKYMPHQGQRERHRRRVGGYHVLRREAKMLERAQQRAWEEERRAYLASEEGQRELRERAKAIEALIAAG